MLHISFRSGHIRNDIAIFGAEVKVGLVVLCFLYHGLELADLGRLRQKYSNTCDDAHQSDQTCNKMAILSIPSEHERVQLDRR